METQITKKESSILIGAIAAVTSGLLSGIVGGCCCCLPFFSGIISCRLYEFMEKRPVHLTQGLWLSLVAGGVAAIPVWLLNLFSQRYLQQNKASLPPEFQSFVSQMSVNQDDYFFEFWSTFVFTSVLAMGVGAMYLLFRKK